MSMNYCLNCENLIAGMTVQNRITGLGAQGFPHKMFMNDFLHKYQVPYSKLSPAGVQGKTKISNFPEYFTFFCR